MGAALTFVGIVADVGAERLGVERVELRLHPDANHQLTEPRELGDLHRRPLTARQIHPKGSRSRVVPMTEALKKALTAIRHLRGERVFFQCDGSAVDETTLRSWMERAQRQAGLAVNKGQIHILRHTICSHLAMRGVPAKVIQELAGHADLTTTMRYMHLAKGSKEAAIAVLDGPAKKNWRPSGDPDSWLKHPEENQEERWRPHRDSNSTERANHNPATTHAKAEFARESEGADRQERLDRP